MKHKSNQNRARTTRMKKTMGKFKRGTLHSGSADGPVVRSRKQEVAIGMARERGKG